MPAERAIQETSQCPACSSESHWILSHGSDRFFRKTVDTFRLVECSVCGLIRLDPFPEEEQLQKFAAETRWWESEGIFEARILDVLRSAAIHGETRFIRSAIRDDRPVLDLSGEHNRHVRKLRDLGLAVESADATVVLQEASRTPQPGFASWSSAPHRKTSPRLFSAILALHVLEHFRDPKSVLIGLRDLLDADGSLVIQVPDAASWEALLLAERWNGFDIPRHPISFREKDLHSLLETSGFEIRRVKRFSFGYGVTGLATSLCPSLDPAVRRNRTTSEKKYMKRLKDLLYGALVLCALPFVMFSTASGSGSSIMIEARKTDVAVPTR